MISVLGVRRLAILLLLLVVNGILGALVYGYALPQSVAKQKELKAVQREVSTLRGDIDRMQVDFDQLESQKEKFEELLAGGFFENQDRRQAEKILSQIQESSGVSKAVASINAGVLEDSDEAEKAKHKILKSPIEVKLEAIDDINIFQYLFLIENYFPGHVAVESIRLERMADVTGTVLRGIASGANPPLVSADVMLVWSTMIPKRVDVDGDTP